MNTILIGLLSGNWERYLADLEDELPEKTHRNKFPISLLAKEWETSLKEFESVEVAIFQPGIIQAKDEFSSQFRRFVQVGNSPSEKLQNLFELGFEKGYSQIIFIEEYGYLNSYRNLKTALKSLEENDMVFGPNDDGSLFLWGMNRKPFWNWTNFDYSEPESIVEMLSNCHESNLTYKVIASYNRIFAESEFRKLVVG